VKAKLLLGRKICLVATIIVPWFTVYGGPVYTQCHERQVKNDHSFGEFEESLKIDHLL
jgi:hypothetical protein